MMQDNIADMLTRIRNAQSAKKENVIVPHSSVKQAILNILKSEGYITGFFVSLDGCKKYITVNLSYYNEKPVIKVIRRVSKPSLRVYCGYDEIPKVLNGLGIAIISTSIGVITDSMARVNKVGGELLCVVS